MSEENQQKPKKSMCDNLKDSVFERIEHTEPYSRWHFLYQESFVWLLWLMSILIGAFATAVVLFVMKYRQFALYEATHDNLFTFIVSALPYIWFAVFACMTLVAVYNMKCTKRGYRYSVPVILLSSLGFSVIGGVVLQSFGLGFAVDHMLGQRVPMYTSQEKLEKFVWQAPEEGRLIGRQVLSTVAPTSTIIFEDIEGNRWNFCVEELSERDLEILASERLVRIVGTTTDETMKRFHACGAFSWLHDKDVSMQTLMNQRQDFLEQAHRHMLRAHERLELFEDKIAFDLDGDNERGERYIPSLNTDDFGLCAETMAVKRIEGAR